MEQKDYVNYKQAKCLKELGFDWECGHYWILDTPIKKVHSNGYFNHNISHEALSSPTLAQAQKWLREIKGIHLSIRAGERNDIFPGRFYWKETHLPNSQEKGEQWIEWWISGRHPWFDTYEDALSDGISKMLELIINKIN